MNKFRQISRVLWLILGANLLVATVKLGLGLMLQMNSLMADGFHAMTDSSSNIIGLIGVKLASKPADKDHPYGHKKFETITGLFIGFMLLIITFQIILQAIKWFISPQVPTINLPSMIALIITLGINIIVAVYEYRKGKELESDVLISDSIHTKSDIFISFGVIITITLIYLGVPPIIDPIVSLIIACFVLHSCYEIFKTTIGVLVDKRMIDEEKIITTILEADPRIIDVHQVRSRGRHDHIFIDLHLLLDGKTSITVAHDLSHEVEAVLRKEFDKHVELIIHIEPDIPNHWAHDDTNLK